MYANHVVVIHYIAEDTATLRCILVPHPQPAHFLGWEAVPIPCGSCDRPAGRKVIDELDDRRQMNVLDTVLAKRQGAACSQQVRQLDRHGNASLDIGLLTGMGTRIYS